LEPIILELEREQNDLLIVAHESVLRVLYGYLMACGARDIPKLQFPRDEIIEVCLSLMSFDLGLLTSFTLDRSRILQQ
jgi:6-phosphofructo-2-kinase/fructose-2,6-biphosphatase 4